MERNVSVVCVCSAPNCCFKFRCNILISGNIIKEMPGLVASGTHCIIMNTKTINLKTTIWILLYSLLYLSERTNNIFFIDDVRVGK
jgi:hypothetical protein